MFTKLLRFGVTAGLLFPAWAAAQTPRATIVARVDSIAASGVFENRAAGLVTAVVQGSDTLLFKGYGKANLEWDVPMPVDAVFEIGSLAKQFTAAAVLQLRDAGKLSLDDDITRWLTDFDTRGHKLPLRRLLDHTSGILGLTEIPEFTQLAINPFWPRDSAYALIKRQPFQIAPGEAQIYNNSAYFLLGLIIEKASGLSYEEYVEKQIFAPLGMTGSMYCNSTANVARRAQGYAIRNGVIQRAMSNVHTWPFAAGSICSTAGDLVKWLTALHGGRVLSDRSYAEMIAPAKLNDGTPTRYGMGLRVGRNVVGINTIGHGGTINGFRAEADWYPDAKLAVVVLMNALSNLDAGAIASEIAMQIVPWQEPVFAKFSGEAALLVGKYKGPSRGRDMVVEVTETPQGLAFSVNGSPARPLPYVGGLTWQGGSALLTFRRGDANRPATELRFDGDGGYYYVLKRQTSDE